MMDSAHSPTSKGGSCKLVSRKQVVYKSRPFVSLCTLLGGLPVRDAILDGELVCLDADGRSQFMELMRRRKQACYYAFDLLWLNGADLRQEALVDRKAKLRKLVRGRAGILYADHLQGGAVEIFRVCCAQDLEGIVIKAARGPYSETPCSWLKVINPNYSQHRGRREMFERFHQRMPAIRQESQYAAVLYDSVETAKPAKKR
jgi:bifunctional non-homologous end joining protein LigD